MDQSRTFGILGEAAVRSGGHRQIQLLLRADGRRKHGERDADASDRPTLSEVAVLRVTPDETCPGGALRAVCEREACGPADEGDGASLHLAQAEFESARTRAPDLSLPVKRAGNTGSGLGLLCGHHVYPATSGAPLSGGRDGLVQPVCPGLETVKHDGLRVLPGCSEWGLGTGGSRDIQHRSRVAVHQHGLHRQAQGGRGQDQHGRQGAGLGQRVYRTTLVERQVRGSLSRRLRKRMGGSSALGSVFSVLQHRATSSGVGLPNPVRDPFRPCDQGKAGGMLLTPDQPNTVLPPPLQSSDELLWPILGSQRERQNLATDHFDGKQQAEKRRLDTGKTLSYFEVKPVQPMGGSSQLPPEWAQSSSWWWSGCDCHAPSPGDISKEARYLSPVDRRGSQEGSVAVLGKMGLHISVG